jgi:hypothetical protein
MFPASEIFWKVPARLHWDLLTRRRYQPGLSPSLKSEKILALLYIGKGPENRPFRDFRPVPSEYQPQAQISNHGRACTQALLLYITFHITYDDDDDDDTWQTQLSHVEA